MHGKSLPVAALSALMCFIGLQGCTSTSEPVPPAADSTVITRDMVTIENLLLWALEGRPAGTDKIEAGLRRMYELKPVRDGYRAEGPVTTADGYVLSFGSIRKTTGGIHIGLQDGSCYPSSDAAKIIGSIADPVTHDAHGVDRGKTFETVRNGVMVYFNTTPETYACVTSIHIHPEAR